MNIILQHWNGPLPSWAILVKKTMERFASEIGCDYELVQGTPMGRELGPNAQKLVYLDEKYDKYDQTLMLDMDIVATKYYRDPFQFSYIGVMHDRAMQGTSRTTAATPALYKKGEYCFFGNFIKLYGDERIAFRKIWKDNHEKIIKSIVDPYPADESILHYLMWKSEILDGTKYADICMRYNGTCPEDIYWRKEDRWDRKFANLYRHSPHGLAADPQWGDGADADASFVHFCRNDKKFINNFISKMK